jgi:hypothetical protein
MGGTRSKRKATFDKTKIPQFLDKIYDIVGVSLKSKKLIDCEG